MKQAVLLLPMRRFPRLQSGPVQPVPEAPRKLAGGEVSPRAGTTGLRPKQRMRLGGCAGEHGTMFTRTLRGASIFLTCSGGCVRGLTSPPANFHSASGAFSRHLFVVHPPFSSVTRRNIERDSPPISNESHLPILAHRLPQLLRSRGTGC